MILLLIASVVAAFVFGRIVERSLMLRDLEELRRHAKAAEQVAITQLIRVLQGR